MIRGEGGRRGLLSLLVLEAGERGCSYGIQALLVLFLVGERAWGELDALTLFGVSLALTDALCLPGGWLIDRGLGLRRALIGGAALLGLAPLLVATLTDPTVGLALAVVGAALIKPTSAALLGRMFPPEDPNASRAYTLYYVVINAAMLVATTACGLAASAFGMSVGLTLAGGAMAAGLALSLPGLGPWLGPARPLPLAGALGALALAVLAARGLLSVTNGLAPALVFVGAAALVAGSRVGEVRASWTLLGLLLFNAVFWTAMEQAAGSLTLFAERHVDREVGGVVVPAPLLLTVNPAFFLAAGWLTFLGRRGPVSGEGSLPARLALGLGLQGAGLLLLPLTWAVLRDDPLPLLALVGLHVLCAAGELWVSPVVHAAVAARAPAERLATVNGALQLSSAMASVLAAITAGVLGGTLAEGAPIQDALHIYRVLGGAALVGAAILGAAAGLLRVQAERGAP